MKRFYKDAAAAPAGDGWHVTLDARPVKTQGGRAQIVPSRALAEALAAEWAAQQETIDPGGFIYRDLADLAIDVVANERDDTIAKLLRYAETDTLCYRAEPDEPIHQRQLELWEPLLGQAESRWDIHFLRIAGVMHQPQPDTTLARLEAVLAAQNQFGLAALVNLTSLSASLVIGLAALAEEADIDALWRAAELEADWEIEQWGADWEAAERRSRRLAAFTAAARFAALAKG